MGNRFNRRLDREEHVERPQAYSCLTLWIKRLVLGFSTISLTLGVLMILCSLVPDDYLLNLSLTVRSFLDETQSALISLQLSDYDLEDPVWFIGLCMILMVMTVYTYYSSVSKKRLSETGITTATTLAQSQPALKQQSYIERLSLEDYNKQAEVCTRVHLESLVESVNYKEMLRVKGLEDVRMWNWQARRGSEQDATRAQESMHIQRVIQVSLETSQSEDDLNHSNKENTDINSNRANLAQLSSSTIEFSEISFDFMQGASKENDSGYRYFQAGVESMIKLTTPL